MRLPASPLSPPPITQTLFPFTICFPLMAFFLCRSPNPTTSPATHFRKPVGLCFRINSAGPIVNSPALYLVQLKLVELLWSHLSSEKPKWQPHATPEWNIFPCAHDRSFSPQKGFNHLKSRCWISDSKRLEVQLLKLTGIHLSDVESRG